ncbi:MAG: hypothetical protein KAJ19_03705 [Gammaproteobacteria bacterium]|nr:hypothetical protein [Gammaproteobacteria bacterium]
MSEYKDTLIVGLDPDGFRVTLTLTLKEKEKTQKVNDMLITSKPGITLSICGDSKHYGGQIHDTIKSEFPDYKRHDVKYKRIARIIQIWERWHLNDLTAGTVMQEDAIREWKRTNDYEYGAACAFLKDIGLYEVKGYKYGTAWLFEKIPDEIITEIKELFKGA